MKVSVPRGGVIWRGVMQRNTKRQGAMSWLWIGFAVIVALFALYVLIGLVG